MKKVIAILEKLASDKVGASQIYRVTNIYGVQLLKTTDPQERTLLPVGQDETSYVKADGGTILTPKDGWKEVKAGGIFKSGDCSPTNVSTHWSFTGN